MRDHGYRIVPVNPTYQEVMGERCFSDLSAAKKAGVAPIDIVDCFRKPEEILPLAHDAIAIGAKVLWMQLGIRNDQAAKVASDAGLDVVMSRCVKIEYARLMGGLNWAGVNTGVISAHRPV
jgi:predicted CoA-binding protein